MAGVFGLVGKAIKGVLGSNLENEFSGPGSFEVRLREDMVGKDEDTEVQRIEGRGIFPSSTTISNAGFITSVLDMTGDEPKPVLTPISNFQEPETVAYFFKYETGTVSPDHYLPDWAPIGMVIPEILTLPASGVRKLTIVVRLIDLDNPPTIEYGFGESPLWANALTFEFLSHEKGYEEEAEDQDEAHALSLKLAMGVAMADGSIDETEGSVLKKWVREAIAPYEEERQQELKEMYNKAMKDAYQQATEGALVLSDITARLNEIGEKTNKLQAVELAYLIMNADGRIDESEITAITKITKSLDLSPEEINNIRDQNIIAFSGPVSVDDNPEGLLGIDPSWDNQKKLKHLTAEFHKWNGHLNVLPEGQKRNQAQKLINLIAELRKQYG